MPPDPRPHIEAALRSRKVAPPNKLLDHIAIADVIRTAPLGNATREATAYHFAKRLDLTPDDAASFVRRALGHAPEITLA